MTTPSALVVDCHHQTAESTALMLLLHGVYTRVAHNLTDALELARSMPPNAIVTAFWLEDEDCSRLIAALRSELPRPPLVIVTTSWDDPEPPPRPTEGIYRLCKPVDPRVLLDLIELHVGPLAVESPVV